jgi:plastocyanin
MPATGSASGNLCKESISGTRAGFWIDRLRFVPKRATVRVGRRVVRRNVGRVAHTVTTLRSKASNKADARVPPGARAWASGFIGAEEKYSRTFKVPGVYR